MNPLDELYHEEQVLAWQVAEVEAHAAALAPFAHHDDVAQQARRLRRRHSRLLAALDRVRAAIGEWEAYYYEVQTIELQAAQLSFFEDEEAASDLAYA